MGKFDSIKEKYTARGINPDHIDYAISSVKDGAKREHIIDNLTADYRGMNNEQSVALLEELFIVNGA